MPDSSFTWEEMKIIDLPKTVAPSKPRFQIFTSGILARCTVLIDTETGNSWSIVDHKQKNADGTDVQSIMTWEPFSK
jgi:hypothetical protein